MKNIKYLFVISTILLITGCHFHQSNTKNKSQLFENAVKKIESLSKQINNGLRLEDDLLVSQTFDELKELKYVEYAVIFDKDKKMIFHSETHAPDTQLQHSRVLKKLFKVKGLKVFPPFDKTNIRQTYMILNSFSDTEGSPAEMLLVKVNVQKL